MQRDLILRNNLERLCLQRQLWLAMVAAERNREFLKTYTSFVWGDLSHYYRTWKMRCFVERPMKGVVITYTCLGWLCKHFTTVHSKCGVIASMWPTPCAALASAFATCYTKYNIVSYSIIWTSITVFTRGTRSKNTFWSMIKFDFACALDWMQAFHSTRIRDGIVERVEGAISFMEGRGVAIVRRGLVTHLCSLLLSGRFYFHTILPLSLDSRALFLGHNRVLWHSPLFLFFRLSFKSCKRMWQTCQESLRMRKWRKSPSNFKRI